MTDVAMALIMGLLIATLGFLLGLREGWEARVKAERKEKHEAGAQIRRVLRDGFE